uniref:Major facilitator superfamily (MFS) profile domain-containing protein n=1 Tax=Plectus sambesii TaxID=2011161 RepID=A0A914XNJ9_9BILA
MDDSFPVGHSRTPFSRLVELVVVRCRQCGGGGGDAVYFPETHNVRGCNDFYSIMSAASVFEGSVATETTILSGLPPSQETTYHSIPCTSIASAPSTDTTRLHRCELVGRTRYAVLILVTLCMSSVWSNILTFNFTVICMKSTHKANQQQQQWNVGPPTRRDLFRRNTSMDSPDFDDVLDDLFDSDAHMISLSNYDYSHTARLMVIGAVAVGALLSSVPLIYLIDFYGPRIVFTAAGLLSAIATALIPIAAELGGLPYFLGLRALQGVAFAVCTPMIGGVTAKWATLKQNGLFISLLTSYLQLAPSFTMPISGALCVSRFGWQSVYYFHAFGCFVLFALFAVFYRNSPKEHPFVSESELKQLTAGKLKLAVQASKQVPYAAIFKTMSVWAVWVAAIGNFSALNLVQLFSPTYLNKVMRYPVAETGLSAALPVFLQFVVKVIAGLTSDKLTCIAETLKVRVYNSVAFWGCGLFFIALCMVPSKQPTLALVMLICGNSILGFTTGGFFKSATLVARHYGQFVMSIVSMVMCLTMVVVPVIVGLATESNTVDEWRSVFLVVASILIATNILFCLFGSSKAALWAQDTSGTENNKETAGTNADRPTESAPPLPLELNLQLLDPRFFQSPSPDVIRNRI